MNELTEAACGMAGEFPGTARAGRVRSHSRLSAGRQSQDPILSARNPTLSVNVDIGTEYKMMVCRGSSVVQCLPSTCDALFLFPGPQNYQVEYNKVREKLYHPNINQSNSTDCISIKYNKY